MAARVKANTLHIKSNLTFDCLIQAEVRNGVVREIGDLKAGQMRTLPLADIEGCAIGEIVAQCEGTHYPQNPLEVVSPVEIEFSGSANGVARFIIGYDATPGLKISPSTVFGIVTMCSQSKSQKMMVSLFPLVSEHWRDQGGTLLRE
ncbi:hypothetical protein R3P38DRAFT_2806672 [Favolaschia claudopus]|uniref:Uncharacterized protein n=1 Tax=Favolaschia claudopus TaxID=2862362 RepID=A0AAV9ZJ94_9AGAR